MKKDLLSKIRDGKSLTNKECLEMIARLSLPAILAEVSYTLMTFIDAAMVGRIGANASASIGLVSSTTWLFGGVMSGVATGFTVQVAHYVGANKYKEARNVVKEGLIAGILFACILTCIGIAASSFMPAWLGGKKELLEDAHRYLLVFACSIVFVLLNRMATGMLECSGNIKLPSTLNILACFLDVIFNMIFIFGLNLGVMGAALGTAVAEGIVALSMCYSLIFKSELLHFKNDEHLKFLKDDIMSSIKIGLPVSIEQMIMGTSYVTVTKIVAPLGTIAIATNSFAITAEGLCYMPGFGIGTAATTIVGQAVGAKRDDLTKKLSYFCTLIGSLVMLIMGILMFINARYLMMLLTTNAQIISLGMKVLRIEAFAEMMYGASIVGAAVFRGMGKTFGSSVINLVSVWAVRIPLMMFLSSYYGLIGVWMGMCIELNVRGLLYIIRLIFNFRNKNDRTPLRKY